MRAEPAARPLLVATLLLAACDSTMTVDLRDPEARLRSEVRLPPGFDIHLFAQNIVRPRSLALGDQGTVFVGSYFFTKGRTSPVYALRDTNGDGRADFRRDINFNFNTPNGIAFHAGTLYVVDEDRVFRIDDVEDTLDDPQPVLIYDGLPSREETDQATDVGHFWRYLAYGPDDRLYVAVGTRWSWAVGAHSANDISDDPIYSTIVRMRTDGSEVEIFADGVRNSMGMTFHPVTGELYFTDNGSSFPFNGPDFWRIPPDEINRASHAGLHFGFPYVHGRALDPVSGEQAPDGWVPPWHEFAPHSAPLGLRFYTGSMFPEEYRNQLFVAEHGTEATTPAAISNLQGDRIGLVRLDLAGNITSYEVFGDGFRQGSNSNYSRRPVDLLVMPDGSLLISDDQAHAIYRVTYGS